MKKMGEEKLLLQRIAIAAFACRQFGDWEQISFDGTKYNRFAIPNSFARSLIESLLRYEVWLEKNSLDLTDDVGATAEIRRRIRTPMDTEEQDKNE